MKFFRFYHKSKNWYKTYKNMEFCPSEERFICTIFTFSLQIVTRSHQFRFQKRISLKIWVGLMHTQIDCNHIHWYSRLRKKCQKYIKTFYWNWSTAHRFYFLGWKGCSPISSDIWFMYTFLSSSFFFHCMLSL